MQRYHATRVQSSRSRRAGRWLSGQERLSVLRQRWAPYLSDCLKQETRMFIAMNRFRVKKGSEEAFEKVWLSRDSQLAKVPGFVEFRLLKGPEHEDFTLYASHSVWQSRATFEAWTRSAEFRAAHRDAGQNKPLYIDHPQFEGFEVRQTVRRGTTAAVA